VPVRARPNRGCKEAEKSSYPELLPHEGAPQGPNNEFSPLVDVVTADPETSIYRGVSSRNGEHSRLRTERWIGVRDGSDAGAGGTGALLTAFEVSRMVAATLRRARVTKIATDHGNRQLVWMQLIRDSRVTKYVCTSRKSGTLWAMAGALLRDSRIQVQAHSRGQEELR
jgi:hypothetical protein